MGKVAERRILIGLLQEASNPAKGGHKLKEPETTRKPNSWMSRCSLL